ncbi:MAG: FAD-dependent tricarballylate dehydrogenase TcuA [Haloferacaceae archaeon]
MSQADSAETLSEHDIAVVGCGMAGLAAGLAAAEAGADVAILEKAPEEHRGGHTRFTESFRVPTAAVELDGYEFAVPDYSPSDYYSDVMRLTNQRADNQLAKTLTREAAPMLEWLTEHGIEWETSPPHPGYTSGRVWLDGEQFVSALVDRVEELGATVYYDAQARRLTRDVTNAVTGVDVVLDGERVHLDVDGVVLASGGYESSKEKRTRYYGPGYENMKVRGSRYNTGEAIDMALDVGAKAAGEWSGAHMAIIDAASPDVEGGITRIDGYQYGVILNHDGERFVDEGEDARASTYAKFGREIFEQPYHEAFIVVDSKTEPDVAHMGPSRPVTGDSIESLAHRLGIEDVDRTVETVEEYNAACDPGEYDPDVLDGNDTSGVTPPKSNWALPLDAPPYTGYPVTGGITFAYGGVAINTDAEVLDTRDEPIEGLYAAGNATGGLFYNNYPGGSGLTNAAVYGRIAGERAAERASR